MSDEMGSYRYAYPQPQPGYAPPYPGQPYYPPQAPPPAQSTDLAAMLIPILVTMPALKSSRVNLDIVRQNLSNITIPADLTVNPPNAQDYNALKNVVVNVKNQLLNAVNNDQAAFAALSQGLMLQLIIPSFSGGGANGSNALMLIVLMMAINGGLGF